MMGDIAPLFVCGSADEAERLALRDYDAIDGSVAHETPYLQQFRTRSVIVTPSGRTAARGVAAVLLALQCEVQTFANGADLGAEALLTLPRKPLFETPDEDTEPPPKKWTLPEPISIDEYESARLAPECIVENYLYADVALKIAQGGTGKTTTDIYEAAHIVLGLPLYGLAIKKPGPVLILTAEDPREILVARMRCIADALNLNDAQKHQIREQVRISDLCGQAFKLTVVIDDVVMPTLALDVLIEEARALAPVLVSIDPAVSFGVGEARVNDAEQGLIEAARRIRRELGCCVRYVHHSGKQNARDGATDQYAGRGGSAMADGARMVAVMKPLDAAGWARETGTPLLEGETGVHLTRPKLSYVPPQPDILILRKGYAFRHTVRVQLTPQEELAGICNQVYQKIVFETDAGRYPTQNALQAALGGSVARDRVRDAIAMLLSAGRIEMGEAPRTGRPGPKTYIRPATARTTTAQSPQESAK